MTTTQKIPTNLLTVGAADRREEHLLTGDHRVTFDATLMLTRFFSTTV